jgi:hypothetical protein
LRRVQLNAAIKSTGSHSTKSSPLTSSGAQISAGSVCGGHGGSALIVMA